MRSGVSWIPKYITSVDAGQSPYSHEPRARRRIYGDPHLCGAGWGRPSLNSILAANYPAYTTTIPDVARAQIFLADLKRFEAQGQFPNLVLPQLPSNHINGTTPGGSTPKAMAADNDFALGPHDRDLPAPGRPVGAGTGRESRDVSAAARLGQTSALRGESRPPRSPRPFSGLPTIRTERQFLDVWTAHSLQVGVFRFYLRHLRLRLRAQKPSRAVLCRPGHL